MEGTADFDKADVEFRWFVKTYTQRSNEDKDIKDPDELLLVGLADPTDLLAAEELRTLLGTGICLNGVDHDALEAAFSRLYGSRVHAE